MNSPAVLIIAAALLMALSGCSDDPAETEHVARVGDQVLTEADVSDALQSMETRLDSVHARQQIIEQWITDALLYREAQRRNLSGDPAVQRRLREQQQEVLINELTNRLYDSFSPEPSSAEIQRYYERHREQLRLRQPFVRIRYLTTTNINTAREVRTELAELDDSATADSLWAVLVSDHAAYPDEARQLAATYHPASSLFARQPAVQKQLADLDPGETAPVIRNAGDSLAHVLQLISRASAGTVPEQAWVEDEIRRRLVIRTRKQMYAREVQRLRNEARARGELDLP